MSLSGNLDEAAKAISELDTVFTIERMHIPKVRYEILIPVTPVIQNMNFYDMLDEYLFPNLSISYYFDKRDYHSGRSSERIGTIATASVVFRLKRNLGLHYIEALRKEIEKAFSVKSVGIRAVKLDLGFVNTGWPELDISKGNAKHREAALETLYFETTNIDSIGGFERIGRRSKLTYQGDNNWFAENFIVYIEPHSMLRR